MNAGLAAIETVLSIAVLAAVANERMCAYGLGGYVLDVRAAAISAATTVARSWLALRGAAGIDTTIAFAIAAVAATTDLQCGLVFDRVLVVAGAALIAIAAAHGNLGFALEGGAAGALALALPWWLTRARGLGLGDVKLAGVLGCALGAYGVLRALWFAFVIGAFVAGACVLMHRSARGRAVPFAPFVALGAALSAGWAAW